MIAEVSKFSIEEQVSALLEKPITESTYNSTHYVQLM